jgi:hypothetical protein
MRERLIMTPRDDPRDYVNPADVEGDSDDVVEPDEHELTNPSENLAVEEVDRELGGNFPLR